MIRCLGLTCRVCIEQGSSEGRKIKLAIQFRARYCCRNEGSTRSQSEKTNRLWLYDSHFHASVMEALNRAKIPADNGVF
ncbi:hypothetical protein OH492_28940 [Vibrio chagasii]|nr:hypothetical protein [Vibrio chagasii]